MYKKALTKKIDSIFDIKQCIFGIPNGTETQNAAWILVQSAPLSFNGDRRSVFVQGEIVVINPPDKMPLGRLYEKYALTRDKTPGKFIITTGFTEGFDHGNNQLTAQKFGFIFEYDEQYNPPKLLQGIKWFWNKIT